MANIFHNNIPDPQSDLNNEKANVALGRFMTAWSQIEGMCGFLFCEIAQLDPKATRIIFDRIGSREQISILRALVDGIVIADERDRIADLMDRVEKLSEKRNKIAHGSWGTYNGESTRFWQGMTSSNFEDVVMETPKGQSLRVKNLHTITDLEALIGACVVLRDTLYSELGRIVMRNV